jgi:hypothetical protein
VSESESETCQRCKSIRVASFSAKSSDLNHVSLGELQHNGYVPEGFGIGDGDYVEFEFCLDCGQLQGTFPLAKTELEGAKSEDDEFEDEEESDEPNA